MESRPMVEGVARTVWMGYEFVDVETRSSVRCVSGISIAIACLQLVFILISGAQTASVPDRPRDWLLILAGFALPVAGFLGAIWGNAPLMGCFCTSNFVLVVLHTVLFAWALISLYGYYMKSSSCSEGNPCDKDDLGNDLALFFWVVMDIGAMVILCPLCAMSSCAWWHGWDLFDRLRHGEVLAANAATLREPQDSDEETAE